VKKGKMRSESFSEGRRYYNMELRDEEI